MTTQMFTTVYMRENLEATQIFYKAWVSTLWHESRMKFSLAVLLPRLNGCLPGRRQTMLYQVISGSRTVGFPYTCPHHR